MESSSEALATTTTSAEIWKNLQDAFNAELADLEAQRKALRQEKEEFEEMKKKIQSVHFSSTVKLDVGGRYEACFVWVLSFEAVCVISTFFRSF